MKLALSNIALSPYDHARELAYLGELGLEAIEVAPSRVWHQTWPGPTSTEVRAYLSAIEAAGLKVVGLHSLLFDHPELGLFRDSDISAQTLDFFVYLSSICRDMGGRTLIFGSGRKRGNMSLKDANKEAADFFSKLCQRIENHGTCFCIEPLGPKDSDFINSAFDSLKIMTTVNHPALKVQLDAKALVANDEAVQETFQAVAEHLVHFHANEPDLGVLGTSGAIDHTAMGQMLRKIGYKGFVSIEQRMLSEKSLLSDVSRSATILRESYQ